MHTAATADVLRKQPGLLGDASRPGLQALPRLVTDAEAALQVWLELAEHTHAAAALGSCPTASEQLSPVSLRPQAGQLQLAQSCLETYFAETSR